MKTRRSVSIILLLAFEALTHGQIPQAFSYQAVVRDNAGNVLSDQDVGVRVSILSDSISGTAVYTETFSVTTNEFGLIDLEIGNGTVVLGVFSSIPWGDDKHFIKIELDPSGGTAYQPIGTSQLLSVPYALLSGYAMNDDNTDEQTLAINDFYLSISNGNEIEIPTLWNVTGSDISYDAGKVSVGDNGKTIQMELIDAYDAGGRNLLVGDDAYLSDVDQLNTLGILGSTDSTIGAIKLGMDGPVLAGEELNLSVSGQVESQSGGFMFPDGTLQTTAFTGDMQNQNITNLADPVNDQDAATKAYVDALLAKIEALESQPGVVKDYDGNLYTTVEIGGQVWMAENLRTIHYNDGTAIPKETDNGAWNGLTTPAYCWYGNDSTGYAIPYGALYNWYAADTGIVCPAGWHVPTDTEWTTLTDYLGGESAAGGKLKESGTVHWEAPNTGATNISGFTALPGGGRYGGGFNDDFTNGGWWSSTGYDPEKAWSRYMYNSNSSVSRFSSDKPTGFSIRCVRD